MEPCRKVYSHKEVVPRTAAQAAQDQQPTSLFWTLLGDMPPFRLPAPPVVAAPRPYKMPDLEDIIVDDPLDDLPLILPEPPLRVPEVPIRDETDDYDIIDPMPPVTDDLEPLTPDPIGIVTEPTPETDVPELPIVGNVELVATDSTDEKLPDNGGDVETSPKFEDEEALRPPTKELPPFVFEDYESDEEDFLKSLGPVAQSEDPRIVHAASLAKGEEEFMFYEGLRTALETYNSEIGSMPTHMPIGTPNVRLELHHLKALARVLKDPIMGGSVKSFVANGWPKLTGLGLKWILNALHCNKHVEKVRFTGTLFNAADARRLVRFIETSPHIHTLEVPALSSIGHNDAALRSLLQVLPTNTSITSLNLDECTYSETTFNMLLAVVSTNTTLEELSLEKSDFSYHNRAQRFMQALIDNTSTKIKQIHFPLMRGAIVWTAQMLVYNQSLTHVNLSGISLGTHSALLQDALKSNKKLANLNLSGTGINDSHLAVLLEPLFSNHTLQVLSLSNNSNLGPQSAKNIAAMLMENTGLTSLYLESLTGMSDDYLAKKLGPALRVNSSLHELSLRSTATGPAGAASLGDCLSVNHALHSLNLSNNPQFDDSCLNALLKHIKSNYGLHSLILSNCKIGDSGVKTLIPLVKTTATLNCRLDLSFNKISLQNLGSLKEAISSNPRLRNLTFGEPVIQASLRDRLASLRSDVLSFFS